MILVTTDDEEKLLNQIRNLFMADTKIEVIEKKDTFFFPKLEINLAEHRVFLDGTEVYIPYKQFRLLQYLASKPGRAFTYEQIYEYVWEEEYDFQRENIMSLIQSLRRKIQPDNSFPYYIENVRDVGYRFCVYPVKGHEKDCYF